MTNGCEGCGARAVGEALPKPAIELLLWTVAGLTVAGSLTVLVFVTQTIIALFQRGFRTLWFWSVVAAGETAAAFEVDFNPGDVRRPHCGLKLYQSD